MDKSWSQLSDRCNLFFTAPDGLYIELLKEAECEIANRCSLFKQNHTILFRDNTKANSFKLPSTFKSMISVFIDGREISFKEKDQWSFTENSTGPMTVQDGTPNYYTLANGFIVFDKVPTEGSADLYFRGNLQNSNKISKTVLIAPAETSQGYVYIDTTFTTELAGRVVKYYEGNTINTLDNLSYSSGLDLDDSDPSDLSQKINFGIATSNDQKDVNYQGFATADSGSWSGSVSNNYFVRSGIIVHYREIGPVIENDYHLNLCDYAIYMASAKKNPELSATHLQIFETRIQEILNDNIDKELPIGMKEEI